jgi:hypothetical protein
MVSGFLRKLQKGEDMTIDINISTGCFTIVETKRLDANQGPQMLE